MIPTKVVTYQKIIYKNPKKSEKSKKNPKKSEKKKKLLAALPCRDVLWHTLQCSAV